MSKLHDNPFRPDYDAGAPEPDRRKTDRRISPAIGEYAIQENARLLARNAELLRLLKEVRPTLEMWKDAAPAVSLCDDIDAAITKARQL